MANAIVPPAAPNSTGPTAPNPSAESIGRLLNTLADPQSLNERLTKQLSYVLRLLPPDLFTPIDKFYEQLFSALKVFRELLLQSSQNSLPQLPPEALVAVEVLALFGALDSHPNAEQLEGTSRPARKLVTRQLIDAVLDFERVLLVLPVSSPFRKPLLAFLAKEPRVALDWLLSDEALIDQTSLYFLLSLLKSQDAELTRGFCAALSSDAVLLARVERLLRGSLPESGIGALEIAPGSLRYVGVRLLELLVQHDAQWISERHELVAALRATLTRSDYLPQFRQLHALDWEFWNEPKFVVRVLLEYYKRHTDEFDLLFDLLPCLTAQLPLNLAFFSRFLDEELVPGFSIDQKRRAFFRFMQLFTDASVSAERKANILQYVIIPTFAYEFERGAQDALIGTAPSPEALDSPGDVVGVLLASFFFDSQSESAQSAAASSQQSVASAAAAAASGSGESSQSAGALTPIVPPQPPVLNDRCRILIYQFLILIVQHAPAHIHDSSKFAYPTPIPYR